MTRKVSTGWVYPDGTVQRTSGLPTGIDAKGTFDQSLNLYTPPGVYPTMTRSRLAAVASGTGDARFAAIGASLTAGYNGSTSLRSSSDISTLLLAALASDGYQAGEMAFVTDDFIANDLRVSVTGSWTNTGQPHNAVYATATGAGTATYPSTRATDSLWISFPGTSTAFSIAVDGAHPASATATHATYTAGTGTVTPDGTSNLASIVVTGLNKMPHTLVITSATGVIIYAAEFYLSNSVRLSNWGMASSQTSHWDDTSAFNTELNQLLAYAPHTVILGLDMAANDYNAAVALSTTLTNLTTIVAALQAAGVEVILMSPPPFLGLTGSLNGNGNPPPTSFWQNFYTLADTKGCWLIDNNARWVSRAVSFALAEYGSDNFHPSALGYQDLTRSIAAVFGQQIVDPWQPNGLQNPATGTTVTIPSAVVKGGTYFATLTANCTFTMPTAITGGRFTAGLKQDGTGSRTATFTGVDWGTAGAPTLTTTANKVDVVTFICLDGVNWLGFTTGTGF